MSVENFGGISAPNFDLDSAAFGPSPGSTDVPSAAPSLFPSGTAAGPDAPINTDPQPFNDGPQQGDATFDANRFGVGPNHGQPQGSYPFSDKSAAVPSAKGADVEIKPQTNGLPALEVFTPRASGNAENALLPGVSAGEQDRPYGALNSYNGGFAQRLSGGAPPMGARPAMSGGGPGDDLLDNSTSPEMYGA